MGGLLNPIGGGSAGGLTAAPLPPQTFQLFKKLSELFRTFTTELVSLYFEHW